MVRITQSKNDKVKIVEDDCIVWLQALKPFWKDQQWSMFPLLIHDVYEWSKKNKCTYLRTQHLHVGDVKFRKALLFKDVEKAKQFRAKWIDPLLFIRDGGYEFTNDEYKWNPVRSMRINPEITQWLYKNKIEVDFRGNNHILFNSTKDMLIFKMRWM